MAMQILRTEKLKTPGNVFGSLAHLWRTRETLNADENRTPHNVNLLSDIKEKADAVARFYKRLNTQEKIRNNAVHAVEYLITASPEFFKNNDTSKTDQYFSDAFEWLKQRHGAENIITAIIHNDETTPHLSVVVVPIDERGILNASKWLDGRKKLSEMQDEFFTKIASKYNLGRGVKGSKAKHETIKDYYARMDKEIKDNEKIMQETDVRRRKTGEKTVQKWGGLKNEIIIEYETDHQLKQRIFKENINPALNALRAENKAHGEKVRAQDREFKTIKNHYEEQIKENEKALADWMATANKFFPYSCFEDAKDDPRFADLNKRLEELKREFIEREYLIADEEIAEFTKFYAEQRARGEYLNMPAFKEMKAIADELGDECRLIIKPTAKEGYYNQVDNVSLQFKCGRESVNIFRRFVRCDNFACREEFDEWQKKADREYNKFEVVTMPDHYKYGKFEKIIDALNKAREIVQKKIKYQKKQGGRMKL